MEHRRCSVKIGEQDVHVVPLVLQEAVSSVVIVCKNLVQLKQVCELIHNLGGGCLLQQSQFLFFSGSLAELLLLLWLDCDVDG